jgi:hypothetical protein
MRLLRQTLLTTFSGFVVYFAVAACTSATETKPVPGADAPGGVPNAMADEWYASGTRLKIRYLEGADGSKQFVGWYDSMRDDVCTHTRHADGRVRCLPPAGATVLNYSDSSCIVRIAHGTKGAPAPKYAAASDPIGLRIQPVTGVYSGPIFSTATGSCAPAESLRAHYDHYALGPELHGTLFAPAEAKNAP